MPLCTPRASAPCPGSCPFLAPASIETVTLLRQVLAALSDDDLQRLVLDVRLPEACEVRGHETLLTQALLTLLRHVLDAHPETHVHLRARIATDALSVEVRDATRAFTDSKADWLYAPAISLDTEWGGQSLQFAHCIALAHRGRLEVKNGPGYHLHIPLTSVALPDA